MVGETFVFLWRIQHKLNDVDFAEQVDQEIEKLSALLFSKGIPFSLITSEEDGYVLVTAPEEYLTRIQEINNAGWAKE